MSIILIISLLLLTTNVVSSAYAKSFALPAPGRLIPVVFCLMFSSKGSSVSMIVEKGREAAPLSSGSGE